MTSKPEQRLTVGFAVADLKHNFRRLKKHAVSHIARPDVRRTACGINIPKTEEWDYVQYIAEFREVQVRCSKCLAWWDAVGIEKYEWRDKEAGYYPRRVNTGGN